MFFIMLFNFLVLIGNPSIVVCGATRLVCQKSFANWTESEPYHDDKPLIEGR